MVRAHIEVLGAAQRGEPDAMSFDRVSGFLRIVTGSPMLAGLAQFHLPPRGAHPRGDLALATRMGVAVDDLAVRIILDTWAVMIAAAVDVPEVATLGPGDDHQPHRQCLCGFIWFCAHGATRSTPPW